MQATIASRPVVAARRRLRRVAYLALLALLLASLPAFLRSRGAAPTYTVQPGDSLNGIAAAHETTVQELAALNADRYPSLEADPGLIEPGWELALPGGEAPWEEAWGEFVAWWRQIEIEVNLPHLSGPGAAAPAPGSSGRAASVEIVVGDPAAEEAILEMINRERASLGLSPLTMDEGLRARARERSRDMLARGYYSHCDPETGTPLKGDAWGEVISRGAGTAAVAVARKWWGSQEHYAIITYRDLHRIGVGVAYGGGYVIVTAQLLP